MRGYQGKGRWTDSHAGDCGRIRALCLGKVEPGPWTVGQKHGLGMTEWVQPSLTRPGAGLLPLGPCCCPWSRDYSRRALALVQGTNGQAEGLSDSAVSH